MTMLLATPMAALVAPSAGLVQFVQSIPMHASWLDGPWVGAIGLLTGVVVTNWYNGSQNTKRLQNEALEKARDRTSQGDENRKRREYEAEEKARDRAAELRRTVYLAAVDEFAAINIFLGGLATLDPTENNLKAGLSGIAKSAARIGLVADESTSYEVNELIGAYTRLFFDLLIDARQVHAIKEEIDRCGLEIQTEKAKPDNLSTVSRLNHDLASLWTKHGAALAQFNLIMMEKTAALGEQQLRVQAALRSELALSTDLDKMMVQMLAQRQLMHQAYDQFTQRLRGIQ